MTIENKLIRHVEGTLASPASLQNKQWKIDVGDDGSGGDLSQLICKDSSGTEHVFKTGEELKDYTDTQISLNAGLATTEGTYTPTLSNLTNLTSTSATTFQWVRTGAHVTIYGEVTGTFTSGSTGTVFELSLPISSNFGNTYEATGRALEVSPTSATGNNFSGRAQATNDTIEFKCYAESSGTKTLTVESTYKVI